MASGLVLICDDDPLLVELLEHRLRQHGYETVTAHDGGEALALLAGATPDAVILESMLPVCDGNELLRRMRGDERLKDIPAIVLSARTKDHDILRALELGASDYVTKPFIPDELLARLDRLVESRAR